jgi:hypothetical protein
MSSSTAGSTRFLPLADDGFWLFSDMPEAARRCGPIYRAALRTDVKRPARHEMQRTLIHLYEHSEGPSKQPA